MGKRTPSSSTNQSSFSVFFRRRRRTRRWLDRVFDDKGNKYCAVEVPESSIIPSNDDFEEVSIDGTSCASKTSSSAAAAAEDKQSAFYMCKACNIYFPEYPMLRRHLQTTHRERKSLLEQLRERVEGYIRNSSGRYVCNYCNFGTYGKNKIANHVASEHGRKVRSVAVRTPRVTVAIETAAGPVAKQQVIDFGSLVGKVEPKPEPEESLDLDMDQFEVVEEQKIEPETEPEQEMLPEDMDQFEQVEEPKIEPDKKEEVESEFDFTAEPEPEIAPEPEPEIEPEPEPEMEPDPDLELVLEAETDQDDYVQEVFEVPAQEVEKAEGENRDNVEIMLEPDEIEEVEIIPADPEVDPIQPDLDAELPAGLEHGEEEMMIVPDDQADEAVVLDEAQIINEEDLHYVQEIEVTAEEAPAEGFEEFEENRENQEGQQGRGGRWPDSMASLLPEELFRCKYCDYSASRRPTLYAHIRRKHRQLWLEATGRREDEHPMSREQLSALGLAKREFACRHCDYASTTRGTLVSHMRNKHPGEEVPPAVRKPLLDLRCDMCDFRTRSRRKIEVHIERKHVTEMRYTCEYCGKKFKVKCDLTSHIRFQHFKTPTICDVCGKICSNTNSLHVHQKREHFKPDFECHICGRRVVSQANLDEHIRRQHEERTKHMCDQCGKVFDQPNKLRQHIMTHTGERPHTCPICKKAFARRAVFRQHFLIHTGERPYVCDICGKAFTQKPGLICHRKMHPGDKPPLPVVYIDHILKRFEKGDEGDEE